MHESLAPFPDLRHHLILIAYRMQEQTGRPEHGLFTLCRSTKRERGLQGKTKKKISSYFMHMQSQWSGNETAVSGSETAVSGSETAVSGSETAVSGSETAVL